MTVDKEIKKFCNWILVTKGENFEYVPFNSSDGVRTYMLFAENKVYEVTQSKALLDSQNYETIYNKLVYYIDWFTPHKSLRFVEESIPQLEKLKNKQFTSINFIGNQLTKEILDVLSTWDFSKLKSLTLENENLISKEDILSFLKENSFPKLERLYLKNYALDSSIVKSLFTQKLEVF
jgi:hypothetical protein